MTKNYNYHLKVLLGLYCCLSFSSFSQAQLNSSKSDEMLKLPLKEVMKLDVQDKGDQEIVSASKKAESIFDAPFSATVVTKDEIIKSGATSIPEALKLVPGVIVRETTNGSYDVYLRGMDNVLPYGNLQGMVSKNTLVMIDNRPVYNYLNGGTFWEMIPIDINDLERIEIVRGAVASLYGPNAVAGVIHLITNKKDNENVDVNANLQYGSFNSIIANTSVGYRANEKFSAIFSTNFQNRERTDGQYFSRDSASYVDFEGLASARIDPAYALPNHKTATNKFGINTFLNYSPSSRVSFDLRAGLQNSEGHRLFADNNITTLQYGFSNSNYVDFEANTFGVKTQISKYSGTVKDRSLLADYDFDVTDAYIEYNYEGIKNLRLSPIMAYRKVIYDDSQHIEEGSNQFQFIQGKQSLGSIGAGLKADYQLNEKLRFIGAIRGEKYEIQDKIYLNYNFASTFKPNENHLFRVAYGKASLWFFLYDSKLDIDFVVPVPIPGFQGVKTTYSGSQSLNPLSLNLLEFGYKFRINKKSIFDIEIFESISKDYISLVQEAQVFAPPYVIQAANIDNTTAKVTQIGATLSYTYNSSKISFKPFVTFQKTDIKDFSPYVASEEANPEENINTISDIEHKGTPKVFGGLTINYQPIKKLNLYLNPYFLGASTFTQVAEVSTPGKGVANIENQFLLNAKIGYSLSKDLVIFFNARNMFSNEKFQHYHTDRIRASYFFGINFDL